MRALSVSLNEKQLCVAGVGDRGVLSAIVNWVAGDRGEDLFLQVGGLANGEYSNWVKQKPLQVGDEVRVRIIETESSDEAIKRTTDDSAEALNQKKNYVRRMANELGWKIETGEK